MCVLHLKNLLFFIPAVFICWIVEEIEFSDAFSTARDKQ